MASLPSFTADIQRTVHLLGSCDFESDPPSHTLQSETTFSAKIRLYPDQRITIAQKTADQTTLEEKIIKTALLIIEVYNQESPPKHLSYEYSDIMKKSDEQLRTFFFGY